MPYYMLNVFKEEKKKGLPKSFMKVTNYKKLEFYVLILESYYVIFDTMFLFLIYL